jgi:hypothetical protein
MSRLRPGYVSPYQHDYELRPLTLRAAGPARTRFGSLPRAVTIRV